ncbi:hypothetical protein V8E36_005012 [Tilletia maclaganii]
MGVRGLTTLCASIEPHISDKVELPVLPSDSSDDQDETRPAAIPFVVDAWAFLYHTFQSQFGDSVFGGEYASYTRLVIDTVAAWRAVNLHPIFVFDGNPPPSKLPTVLSRLSAKCANLSLFMRSSADSRLSARWQTSLSFLPPLLLPALREALKRASVDLVLAEGEADPVIVGLAGKLGGYAVSKDSDFFVLNPVGGVGRYKGYVPVDSISYVCQRGPDPAEGQADQGKTLAAAAESGSNQPAAAQDDDDGFTTVSAGRKGRRGRASQIAPAVSAPAPTATTTTTSTTPTIAQSYPPLYPTDPYAAPSNMIVKAVTFSTYLPSKLAAHFDLPPTLLPMVGPLLGNDTSSTSHFRVLFPPSAHEDRANGSGSANAGQRALLCMRALKEEWVYATTGAGRNLGGGSAGRAGTSTPGGASRAGSVVGAPPRSRQPSTPGLTRGLSSTSASTPGSPNPWRSRLASGSGGGGGSPTTRTPGSSSSSNPSSGGKNTASNTNTPNTPKQTGSGLDSSFVSIRSLGSSQFTTSGFSTPRGARAGSEWGGNSEAGDLEGADGEDEDDVDDGASLVSDLTPADPVRALIVAVLRRIVLSQSSSSASASSVGGGAGTSLPMGRNRRAAGAGALLVSGEGTAEWEEVVDAILEGVRSYSASMQVDPEDVENPDLSRFTAHLLPRRTASGQAAESMSSSTLLIDDEVVPEGGECGAGSLDRLAIMRRYAQAFHAVDFAYSLPHILFGRSFVANFAIEDPDQSTVAVHAPRHLRRWVYAILFGAYGLEWARETIAEPEEGSDGDTSSGEGERGDGVQVPGARPVRGGLTSSWIMPNARESDGDPDELILVQTPPSVSSYVETDEESDGDGDGDEAAPQLREAAQVEDQRARGRDMTIAQEEEDTAGPKAAPVVQELVRRGERYVQEAVPIPSLSDLFAERPLTDDPDERLREYAEFGAAGPLTPEGVRPGVPTRHILSAGLGQALWKHVLRAGSWMDIIPHHLLHLAATLRFLVLSEAERFGVSAPRYNWRKRELEAAAYSGCVGIAMWRAGKVGKAMGGNGKLYPGWYSRQWVEEGSGGSESGSSWRTRLGAGSDTISNSLAVGISAAAPSVRAIHLSSTLQATLEATRMLSEALLLHRDMPPPSACHEGPLFHAYLTEGNSERMYSDAEVEYDVGQVLWAVSQDVDEGLSGKDLEEERRKKRKERRKQQQQGGDEACKEAGQSKEKKVNGIANLYAALQVE